MVDVAASKRAGQTRTVSISPAHSRAVILPADETGLDGYAELAQDGLAAPAQSAAWVRAWAKNVASNAVVATLHLGERPALALALDVEKTGPITIGTFMGGRHANGNFPACDRTLAADISPSDLAALFDAIRHSRPDIDLLKLERLAPEIGGVPNPLLQLDNHPSPNMSLAVGLDGGFNAVLERTSAKRKRKKHRSQTRKFETAGGFRRLRAETPEGVQRLLSAFFEMKEQRFRKMGIANVFGDPNVRRFFGELFSADTGAGAAFRLDGLEVAGKLRAVTGSSVCGNRLICEFGAIAEDDLAHASPGDFLFFGNICEAAEAGFAIYDFSVGDEPYKRLWCNIEIAQYDVLVPLTLKGRAFAGTLRAVTAAKTMVKNNPKLWAIAKRLRKGTAAAPVADSD